MAQHIYQLIDALLEFQPPENAGTMYRPSGADISKAQQQIQTLANERRRLEVRDFEVSVQVDFAVARDSIAMWTTRPAANPFPGNMKDVLRTTRKVLDGYVGAGNGGKRRQFPLIANPSVRDIVERDYHEMMERAWPGRAWKSVVILAGSILEAVLYDRLTKDQNTIRQAMSAKKAPKHKGNTRDITLHDSSNQWKLFDLIEVSAEINVIRAGDAQSIHNAVREYRNFVHPFKEAASGDIIFDGHAKAAVGVLDIVLRDLGY